MVQYTVIEFQSLQTHIEPLDQMFPRQPAVVDGIVAEGAAKVDLGGDDEVVALPAKLLDRLAHHSLRLSRGIALGAVEEVDAGVVRGLHARE